MTDDIHNKKLVRKVDNKKSRRKARLLGLQPPGYGCGLSRIGNHAESVRIAFLSWGQGLPEFAKLHLCVDGSTYMVTGYASDIYLSDITFQLGGKKSTFNTTTNYSPIIPGQTVEFSDGHYASHTIVTFPVSSRYFFKCWGSQLKEGEGFITRGYSRQHYTSNSFVMRAAITASRLSNFHLTREADERGGFMCEVLQKLASYCPIDKKCKYNFMTTENQIIIATKSSWYQGLVAIKDTSFRYLNDTFDGLDVIVSRPIVKEFRRLVVLLAKHPKHGSDQLLSRHALIKILRRTWRKAWGKKVELGANANHTGRISKRSLDNHATPLSELESQSPSNGQSKLPAAYHRENVRVLDGQIYLYGTTPHPPQLSNCSGNDEAVPSGGSTLHSVLLGVAIGGVLLLFVLAGILIYRWWSMRGAHIGGNVEQDKRGGAISDVVQQSGAGTSLVVVGEPPPSYHAVMGSTVVVAEDSALLVVEGAGTVISNPNSEPYSQICQLGK